MNTIELTNRAMERASDWLNPILVKETRQALKSRQFVITFTLMLFASWVISTYCTLTAGDAIEYGSVGSEFFYLYYFVLAIAIFVVVPFGAFRSLLSERDENTYDLLSITTLKPRQIVWGKLLGALVQLFIFYSAIAPFMAFASLLEGFDLAQVTFLLVISFLASMAASMVALMLSTMARQKQWQALNILVVLAALVILFICFVSMAGAMLHQPMPFDEPDFWWAMGFMLLGVVTYFILVQQITTAQLTFESGNRSTGIRITASVQFVLLWVCLLVYLWYTGTALDEDAVMVCVCMSAIHWAAVGLFVTTEDDHLSRRIRRRLPHNPALRLLWAPFLPGGGRGFAYLTLHLLMCLGLVVLLFPDWNLLPASATTRFGSDEWMQAMQWTVTLCGYLLFYLGVGTALGRLGRYVSADIRPAHARVMIVLLFAAGVIVPYLPSVIGINYTSRYTLLHVTNPITSIWEIDRESRYAWEITTMLFVGGLIGLALNSLAMRRGVVEVVAADVPPHPPRESQPVLGTASAGGRS